MRYYLLNVTIASNGNESRNLTPYDNLDTAERKFHEALVGIGAGSRRIAVVLLDYNLNQVKKEIWQQYFTVSYDVNGGVSSVNPTRVASGDSVVLPSGEAITPEGKTFAGWSTSQNAKDIVESPYTPTDNVTLYAIYQ